ncbi:hypothetical protein P3T76_014474 [Phytophthora citrophthora]|uniref:Uncharacterized protein n=1 Tax=Phytophthora citrophthora TaxID=4793 RepID=A0AAD9LC01_9STRA|nr:hypothetical protein P3T76_014474 [Phytophthora citrophthora]
MSRLCLSSACRLRIASSWEKEGMSIFLEAVVLDEEMESANDAQLFGGGEGFGAANLRHPPAL